MLPFSTIAHHFTSIDLCHLWYQNVTRHPWCEFCD